MASWARTHRWGLSALTIALAAFVVAVWLIAIRPAVEAAGDAAVRVSIDDEFVLGGVTVSDMSVAFQQPATDRLMSGTEALVITVTDEPTAESTYNCRIQLRYDGTPTLTFRPTAIDLGLTGDASYPANCVGSPNDEGREYLVFLIPEGLTGDFTLRLLDADQPVEVAFSR